MKDPNWAECPEATHFDPVDQNFLREVGEALLLFNNKRGWIVPTYTAYGLRIEECQRPLLKRPAWNGEGLPVVGETIERLDINANWVDAVVMYVGTDRVALRDPSGQEFVPKLHELTESSDFKRFRPVRTAEQIDAEQRAAENRKRQIDDMYQGLSHSNASETRRICAELFDKGYRKQEAL
ncbi:hypothetical protein ACLEJW_09080 [Pseudomonas sp. SMSB3]|uniref:hypothetical protein n=1 Tax=Pseudomonas sp. SMSB3 TaxID=3390196 RepID=UPI003F82AFE9